MNRTLPLLLVLGALAAPASAQPLRVQDRDGNAVVLPEPGAVTLVQFMATWCAPCHEQTKALVELHQTYSARGVHIMAVSLDRPAEHKLLPIYIEEFAVPYPLLVRWCKGSPDCELVAGPPHHFIRAGPRDRSRRQLQRGILGRSF